MKKLIHGLVYLCFAASFFSCTSKGEDDPWLSFRSRDARLKENWKLVQMENTFEMVTTQRGSNTPNQLLIATTFDGTNMHFRAIVNNQLVFDTLIGYSFNLHIRDDGELYYQYVTFLGGIGVKSSGDDNWFWQSDDRRKSKVNLGQAMLQGVSAGNDLSLLAGFNLQQNFQSFDVTELRKGDLNLRLNKRQLITNLNGNVQELKISHSSTYKDD